MKMMILFLFPILAQAADTTIFQYTGFHQGQMAVGVELGVPTGLRLQRFLSWRSSVFVTGGYSIDKYATTDANYSYYLFSQEDPWHETGRTGYVFYDVFGGVTAAFPFDQGDSSRLGFRGGIAFEYLLPSSAWTLRAEVAPVLYLAGQTAAGFQSGLIAMYHFDNSVKHTKSRRPVDDTQPKRHP